MSNNTFFISSIRNEYIGDEALNLRFSFNDEAVQTVLHHSVNFMEGDGVVIPLTDKSSGLDVPEAGHFVSVKYEFGEQGAMTNGYWSHENSVFGGEIALDGSIIQDTIDEIADVHSAGIRIFRIVATLDKGKPQLELVRPYRANSIINMLPYAVQVRYTLPGSGGPQGEIISIEADGGTASVPGNGIGFPILSAAEGDTFMEENDRMWLVVENNEAEIGLLKEFSLWQSGNSLQGACKGVLAEVEHGYTAATLKGNNKYITLIIQDSDNDGIVIFGEQTVEP